MTAVVLAGLLAGYGIAIPVGAIGAYLVGLTARTSLRVGAAAALGIATVDGVYALVAMFGGGPLAEMIAPVAGVLRWIAAGVLLAVAVQVLHSGLRRYRASAAQAPPRPEDAPSPARAYAAFLAMTLLNPTTIIYFVAVVLGGQARVADTWTERSAFVTAAFLASASWQLLLAGGGTLLGRVLTGRRGQLGTALLSGSVIAFLAVHTLWS
ncbi:LysE family transporter [Amycolatopsis cynarae]|uniref:LysE family transporter n=1 Tax=Amycolatopsis cynarae TaxID=2995223 RepID=A0ABY7AUD9_9PSEU|nr:LysE family transporter [Amycolatopsis sp. HUAS 11-8]WAL63574.1 LysE family transporter [Amycolatopsis sp. HUAS 11-8]